MDFLKPYTSQLLSVLRVMSALLLLQHGTGKYLSIPVGPMNNASPVTMSGTAGILELIGGVNNLGDKEPPACLSCSLNGYDASNYDLPGRFYYVEANFKF